MKKRGAKPKGKVRIEWSADFAYAVGLLVSDGCLSSNGRHILFTSKDKEQIRNFVKALGLDSKIGTIHSGHKKTSAYRVQFGDVLFYRFLVGIGVTPTKSKTIGSLNIPEAFFFDFLRGVFDGDGSTYSYWDLRWKSSFMYYVEFSSASPDFLTWIQKTIQSRLHITGHRSTPVSRRCSQLRYAKRESLIVLRKMYKKRNILYLRRKRLKIDKMLGIVGMQL